LVHGINIRPVFEPEIAQNDGATAKMTDAIVVLTTCATEADAERIARALIAARLVACVSVVPLVRSFYRWKAEVESAAECLLLLKTSRELFEPLGAALEKLHPYEVPELLALPVVAGAANYLNWLAGNLLAETPGTAE
jgi:periplasmic divalent cation tolerance protein